MNIANQCGLLALWYQYNKILWNVTVFSTVVKHPLWLSSSQNSWYLKTLNFWFLYLVYQCRMYSMLSVAMVPEHTPTKVQKRPTSPQTHRIIWFQKIQGCIWILDQFHVWFAKNNRIRTNPREASENSSCLGGQNPTKGQFPSFLNDVTESGLWGTRKNSNCVCFFWSSVHVPVWNVFTFHFAI